MPINCTINSVKKELDVRFENTCKRYDGKFTTDDTYVPSNKEDIKKISAIFSEHLKQRFKVPAIYNSWLTTKEDSITFKITKDGEKAIELSIENQKNTEEIDNLLNQVEDVENAESNSAEAKQVLDLFGQTKQFLTDSTPINHEQYLSILEDIYDMSIRKLNIMKNQSKLHPENFELRKDILNMGALVEKLREQREIAQDSGSADTYVKTFNDILVAVENLVLDQNENLGNTAFINEVIKRLESSLGITKTSEGTTAFNLEELKIYEQKEPDFKKQYENFVLRVQKVKKQHEVNTDDIFSNILDIYFTREKIHSDKRREEYTKEEWDKYVEQQKNLILANHRKDIQNLESWLKEFSELSDEYGLSLSEAMDNVSFFTITEKLFAYNKAHARQGKLKNDIAIIKGKLYKRLKKEQPGAKRKDLLGLHGKFFDYSIFFKTAESSVKRLVTRFNVEYDRQMRTLNKYSNQMMYHLQEGGDLAYIKGYEEFLIEFESDFEHVPIQWIEGTDRYFEGEYDLEQVQKFKNEYIEAFGEVEYENLKRQAHKAYGDWYAFTENLVKNTLKKHNILLYEDLKKEHPEVYDRVQNIIEKTSPIKIGETTIKNKQNNSKIHKEIIPIFTISKVKDSSKETYFDKNFTQIINDELYYEAYKVFQEALKYVNLHNHSGKDTDIFDIPYYKANIKNEVLKSYPVLGTLPARTLKNLKRLFSIDAMSEYKDPQHLNTFDITGGMNSVKSVINKRTKKTLRILTQKTNVINYKEQGENVKIDTNIFPLNQLDIDFIIKSHNISKERIEEIIDEHTIGAQINLKDAIEKIVTEEVEEEQSFDIFDILEVSVDMAEIIDSRTKSEEELKFLYNKLESISIEQKINNDKDSHEIPLSLRVLQSFITTKVYGVNNREHWLSERVGKQALEVMGGRKDDFIEATKEIIESYKEILKDYENKAKELSEKPDSIFSPEIYDDDIKKIKKEIKQLEKFVSSNGKVITTGSLLYSYFTKVIYFNAFLGNLKAAYNNMFHGSVNAYEVDGLLWDAGNYPKAKAKFNYFRRRSRQIGRSNETISNILGSKEAEQYAIATLMFQKLGVFQASTDHIYKINKGINSNSLQELLYDNFPFGLAKINSIAEREIQMPQIMAILASTNKDGTPKFPIKGKNSKGEDIVVPLVDLDGPVLFPAFTFVGEGKLELKPEFDTVENRATWIDNSTKEWAALASDKGPVGSVISFINGNYSDSNFYRYDTSSTGFLLMMFKRFFLNHIHKRSKIYGSAVKEDKFADAMATEVYSNMFRLINTPISFSLYNTLFSSILDFSSGITGLVVGSSVIASTSFMFLGHTMQLYNSIKNVYKNTFKSSEFTNKTTGEKVKYLSRSIGNTTVSASKSLGLVLGKSVQLTVNKLAGIFTTNDYIIKNKHLNSLLKYEQDAESTKALHFLAVGAAHRLLLTIGRIMVLALISPDDDDEDEFKQVQDKPTIERFIRKPDVVTYILLDNLMSDLIYDINSLSSQKGVEGILTPAFKRTIDNLSRWALDGETEYTQGLYEGRSKKELLIQNMLGLGSSIQGGVESTTKIPGTDIYFPTNINFGFNSITYKRYNTTDFISRSFQKTKKTAEQIRNQNGDIIKKTTGLSGNALKAFKKEEGLHFSIKDSYFDKKGNWINEEQEWHFNQYQKRVNNFLNEYQSLSKKQKKRRLFNTLSNEEFKDFFGETKSEFLGKDK